jgi:TRAP-type C4-dicarboxylate transport system permease small subunit
MISYEVLACILVLVIAYAMCGIGYVNSQSKYRNNTRLVDIAGAIVWPIALFMDGVSHILGSD